MMQVASEKGFSVTSQIVRQDADGWRFTRIDRGDRFFVDRGSIPRGHVDMTFGLDLALMFRRPFPACHSMRKTCKAYSKNWRSREPPVSVLGRTFRSFGGC
jgi:hypothetical protein